MQRDGTCSAPNGGSTTALQCSSGANCDPGTVCCVTDNGAGRIASACKPQCRANEAQLCDPAASSTGCARSAACSSSNVGDWGLPKSYATCGGKGN